MAQVFRTTRHTTCIPEEVGGSGNPSIPTAHGVVVAMEAALDHLGHGTLEGKTVAVQGLGNVASAMIRDLIERREGRIVGADIDERAVAQARARFAGAALDLRLAGPHEDAILAEPCDILAPNAVGAVLNDRTIPRIRARIVCGAANNQLEEPRRDATALRDGGILYVPDFLANRMGIVSCANEQYGMVADDPVILGHLDRGNPNGIFQRAQEVFRRAGESGRTTAEEAERLADELGAQLHPIWGHRGRVIIDHLVRSGWDRGRPVGGP
jgi:glutamate dehydrogenase/leucine dehydrogenase